MNGTLQSLAVLPRVTGLDVTEFGAVAGLVYAGKAFYAAADVVDLGFILRPTVVLVEYGLATPFPFEHGVGYVSLQHATAIVAGCAGMNFLLAVFTALSLGLGRRFQGWKRPLWWLAALLLAYLTAIAVNALRITLDVLLRPLSWLPHDEMHRMLGTVVCFLSLCLVYTVCAHALPQGEAR